MHSWKHVRVTGQPHRRQAKQLGGWCLAQGNLSRAQEVNWHLSGHQSTLRTPQSKLDFNRPPSGSHAKSAQKCCSKSEYPRTLICSCPERQMDRCLDGWAIKEFVYPTCRDLHVQPTLPVWCYNETKSLQPLRCLTAASDVVQSHGKEPESYVKIALGSYHYVMPV